MYIESDPPPLPLDKVLENRSISSNNSPLFKIPLEILNNIGSQLPSRAKDLASLALVNTECRQLARSWQFRTLRFRYNRSSENLFRLLQQEALERCRNQGRTYFLSLGVCVRRVIIAEEFFWTSLFPNKYYNSDRRISSNFNNSLDDEERSEQLQYIEDEFSKRVNENNWPYAHFVLSSLIHLESLSIGTTDLNQILLNTLAALPIKSFELIGALVSEIIPIMNISEWRLEKLSIFLNWEFYPIKLNGTSKDSFKNCEVALRSCAPFLRALMFYQDSPTKFKLKENIISSVFEFPNLRFLQLSGSHLGISALRSFLLTSPYLSKLTINYGYSDVRKFLDLECRIASLKTLILTCDHGSRLSNLTFDFLKMNLQLEGFAFNESKPNKILVQILRLLKDFRHLKMLSMIWDRSYIPKSALEDLASLTTIENLHLSVDMFQDNWRVCHYTMIERLRSLTRLKRLAFNEDQYYYNENGILTKYMHRYGKTFHVAAVIHYQQMHEKALAYAHAFPNLELLHIGSMTYEIIRLENDIKLKADDNRYFCWRTEILNMSP